LSSTTAALSQFSVQVAGATRAISSVAVSGSTVQLTLSSPVIANQAVTVAYTDPTPFVDNATAVQDLSGNDAASLGSTAVINAAQLSLPSVAKDMFLIKGDNTVSSWVVKVDLFNASNASIGTRSFRIAQDASGNNIEFSPNFNDIGQESFGLGFHWTFSVKGYASNGTTLIKDGLLGGPVGATNPSFYSTFNFNFAGINSNGVTSNLPAYAGNNLVALFSSDGTNVFSKGFTLASLSTALANDSLLQQYATNNRLGAGVVEGSVSGSGINTDNPYIYIGNYKIPMLGHQFGAYSPMAIKSSANTTVKVWTSNNGGSFSNVDTLTLKANEPTELDHWGWGLTLTNNGAVTTTRVYFADSSGNSIPSLKTAILPASTGGFLSDSDWRDAGAATLANPFTIYTGTVAQILASNVSGTSTAFIRDTYENIKAGGTSLYNLITNGRIIGSRLTNGFDGIAGMSTSELSAIEVVNSSGNKTYVHMTESGANSDAVMKHAAIAANGTGNYSISIDGVSVKNLANISGPTGVVLSNSGLSTLSSGSHTLSISGNGQLGIVPPGGGLNISFANTITFWIGSASQLPTSLADITANTLYVIRDTSANLLKLDGYASGVSGVVANLANSGLIVYSPTTNLNWLSMHQLQQDNSNYAIANVSDLIVDDVALEISQNFWSSNDGIKLAVTDSYATLTNPVYASAANKLSSGNYVSVIGDIGNSQVGDAFNNHRISLVDGISNLFNIDKISNIASQYYGAGSLSQIILADSVSNFSKVADSSTAVNINFKSLVITNASSKLVVDINDTVSNVYNLVTGAGFATFKSQLLNAFAGTGTVYTKIQLQDSVANLKAAFDIGKIATIETAAKAFNSSDTSKNLGLEISVKDTMANMDPFIASTDYLNLSSQVKNYVVEDTASNILSGINDNNWNDSIRCANEVIVKDTYQNIFNKANIVDSTDLFDDYATKVTKIIFTDITGADPNTPFVIPTNYSYSGLMPVIDFSQATGFTGNVTVTESDLISWPTGFTSTYGSVLTVADTNSHSVKIEILSNNSNEMYLSSMNVAKIILPAPVYTEFSVSANGVYTASNGPCIFNIDSNLSANATINGFGSDDVLRIVNRTSTQGVNFVNSAWNDGNAVLYSGAMAVNLTGLNLNSDTFVNEAGFKSLYGSAAINYAVI